MWEKKNPTIIIQLTSKFIWEFLLNDTTYLLYMINENNRNLKSRRDYQKSHLMYFK